MMSSHGAVTRSQPSGPDQSRAGCPTEHDGGPEPRYPHIQEKGSPSVTIAGKPNSKPAGDHRPAGNESLSLCY